MKTVVWAGEPPVWRELVRNTSSPRAGFERLASFETRTLTLALTLALALALTFILNHNPSRNLALAFRPPLPLTGPDEDPLKWTDARPLMQAIDT